VPNQMQTPPWAGYKQGLMKVALVQPDAAPSRSGPRDLALAIWRYRGFVLSMVQRELRQRYAQSFLGSLWNVIHPLTLILVYTLVFSQVMHSRLPGTEMRFGYSIYLCAGLLPWTLFSASLDRGVGVFVEQANLIKKVNFPRVTLPLIVQLSALADFAIVFAIYLLFLLAIGWFPGWAILAMIPLLAIQQAFSAAIGVLLGCLNVYVRDTKQIVSIVLQFWFWFTPVVYATAALPRRATEILRWNPVWPVFNAYHDLFLNRAVPDFRGIWLTVLCALVIGAAGAAAYRRLSPGMTDEL
jgi:lipopolysaccharide transport system permease protein